MKSKTSEAQATIIDLAGNNQSIEDSHIVPGTRDTYNQQLVCFMHYIYNNHDNLLVYRDALYQADVRDKARLYTLADYHDYCRYNA